MIYTICSIIKNEHLYLKEWIDYHLNLGFTNIYLYEDFGSESHRDIVKDYDNVYLSTLKDFGISETVYTDKAFSLKQIDLYNKFLLEFKSKSDWILFIDVDEFLGIDNGLSLLDINSRYSEYTGVYLYWKLMGASNHIKRPTCNIIDAYTKELDYNIDLLGCNIKSFVNTKNINEGKFLNAHLLDVSLVNTIKLPTTYFRNHRYFWLNHYFTKSWEDWLYRFKVKGDLVPGNRRIELFFDINQDMLPLKEELMSLIDY